MAPNLSDETRTLLTRAAEESRKLHHEYVGTEHLLLALLSHTPTVETLAHFQLTPEQIRAKIAALIQPGSGTTIATDVPLTPRAQRSINLAAEEIAIANQSKIEPPHVLLGLFREGNGIAALTLQQLRPALTLQSLREQIFRIRFAQLRLIERTVRPLHAGTPRKLKMREELLAHLESIYTEELARTQTPDTALAAATHRFGTPADLTRELQSTIPAHERLSWHLEKRVGWRAPEHASRFLLRFSLQFLLLEIPLALFAAILIYIDGPAPFTIDGLAPYILSILYPALLGLLAASASLFLLGNLYFLTRDALFGVFGSPKSKTRVALLSAATSLTTLLIALAFMTASAGSLHLSPSNFAAIAAAALLAPIVSLLSALRRGPTEIQQTHWECLNLDAH